MNTSVKVYVTLRSIRVNPKQQPYSPYNNTVPLPAPPLFPVGPTSSILAGAIYFRVAAAGFPQPMPFFPAKFLLLICSSFLNLYLYHSFTLPLKMLTAFGGKGARK